MKLSWKIERWIRLRRYKIIQPFIQCFKMLIVTLYHDMDSPAWLNMLKDDIKSTNRTNFITVIFNHIKCEFCKRYVWNLDILEHTVFYYLLMEGKSRVQLLYQWWTWCLRTRPVEKLPQMLFMQVLAPWNKESKIYI